MKNNDVDPNEPRGYERLLLPYLTGEEILTGIRRAALPPLQHGGYSLGEYLGILESGLAAAIEKRGKYGAERWLAKEMKRSRIGNFPKLLPPQMAE